MLHAFCNFCNIRHEIADIMLSGVTKCYTGFRELGVKLQLLQLLHGVTQSYKSYRSYDG